MADIRRSATQYSITISSDPPATGGMSVWALRDLVRALDEAGIPNDAMVIDEHANDTGHLVRLRVRHVVTIEQPLESDRG